MKSPMPRSPAASARRAARAPDPRRLDVVRFAAGASELDGVLGAAELPRLTRDAPLAADGVARWAARGEQRRPAAAQPETWLHLQADAEVELTCQRCLQSMLRPLAVERAIRFVTDEAEAERLDEDSDDDVLAVPPRGLDLTALVEDELILALPLVPRHETCPQPLPGQVATPSAGEPTDVPSATRRPFEALRALRSGRDPEEPAD